MLVSSLVFVGVFFVVGCVFCYPGPSALFVFLGDEWLLMCYLRRIHSQFVYPVLLVLGTRPLNNLEEKCCC
jgi:hypothetical protein